jgi:hypothetical protein
LVLKNEIQAHSYQVCLKKTLPGQRSDEGEKVDGYLFYYSCGAGWTEMKDKQNNSRI